VPPVVLLHGPDVQLLDDALAALTRRLLPDPASHITAREIADGEQVPVDAIVLTAQTLPFLAPARLVAVRRCHALAERDALQLAAYVRNPNPTTCLLLLSEEPLAAGRDRRTDHWLLGVVPRGATVAIPARDGRTLEAWLVTRAASEGLAVSEPAARLLVQWVGDDGARLLGEVRKAVLAGEPGGRTVGEREVAAVVGEQRLAGVFDLTRAVARGEVGPALETLDRLLGSEEPVRLVALLTGEVRTAWRVVTLRAQGRSAEEISRVLRRPRAAVEAIGRAHVNRPPAVLASQLRRCWEIEDHLKSGGEARSALTLLVAELCGER